MKSMKSSARTLEMLELMTRQSSGLSMSEMPSFNGILLSSMHGLVTTLEERVYLLRDAKYRRSLIGPM